MLAIFHFELQKLLHPYSLLNELHKVEVISKCALLSGLNLTRKYTRKSSSSSNLVRQSSSPAGFFNGSHYLDELKELLLGIAVCIRVMAHQMSNSSFSLPPEVSCLQI